MTCGTDFSAILARAGLTKTQAARLCGVSPRTLNNWLRGKTQPSPAAIAALEIAITRNAPVSGTLAERIAALAAISQQQWHRCCQLEDELAAERAAFAATNRALNALYAERDKLEKAA